MPEGPEIWRAADTIRSAIVDKKVNSISFAFDHLKEMEPKLNLQQIISVKSYGKAIVTSFENGFSIYSHNQLYGKWYIMEKGLYPDTNRQLRLEIHTEDKSALLYSASEIEVIESESIFEHSYISKLGPDVVDPSTTFDEVLERFKSDRFKNRSLSSLLLDQSFLSGVGNYLRSEILFYAGVLPNRKPVDCSSEELTLLAQYSLELPVRSYQTNGLTTPDELVEALKREGVKRSDYRHYAYGRAGKACYKCGTEIEVIKTGGRKVFFCPDEQK